MQRMNILDESYGVEVEIICTRVIVPGLGGDFGGKAYPQPWHVIAPEPAN